jgi:hypothetical protein
MALTFGAATSDRVTYGNPGNLTEASAVSFAVWFQLSTFTAGRRLMSKSAQDGNGGPAFSLTGTDELQMTFTKSSVNALANSNTLTVGTGVWYCAIGVYDPADTQPRIYFGSLTAPIAEVGYAAGATIGSGTSNSTANLVVGNQANAGPTLALQGDIARAAAVYAVMTLADMQRWQFKTQPLANCKLLTYPGLFGTGTQPDYSGNGNHGTVTGATVTAPPPLSAPFGRRRYFVPAAAGVVNTSITPRTAVRIG